MPTERRVVTMNEGYKYQVLGLLRAIREKHRSSTEASVIMSKLGPHRSEISLRMRKGAAKRPLRVLKLAKPP